MSTPIEIVDPPAVAGRSFMSQFAPLAQTWTIVAVLIYVIGFLIVTLRNAQFHFFEIELLKPKAMAAGILFLMLTVAPIFSAIAIFEFGKVKLEGKAKLAALCLGSYYFLYACYVLAFVSRFMFSFDAIPKESASRREILSVVFLVSLVIAAGITAKYEDIVRTHPLRVLIPSAIVVVMSVINLIPQQEEFSFRQLVLWYFASGIVGAECIFSWRNLDRRRRRNWVNTPFMLLGMFVFFPRYVYPHIDSAWGGGNAVKVSIQFAKDSSFMPGSRLETILIDESDQGFYVKDFAKNTTTFIPRQSVALLVFLKE